MAYTRTWNAANEASPADVDNVSEGAAKIRNLKTDISERLAKDHYFDIAGTDADHGEHNKITLRETTKPASVANKGFLYSKDVGGVSELCYEDSSGNEAQITTAGAVGSTPAIIAFDANNKTTMASGSATVKIAGADQVKVADGTVEPITDNDVDLGTSTKQFKDTYLKGVIVQNTVSRKIQKVSVSSASTVTISSLVADAVTKVKFILKFDSTPDNISVRINGSSSYYYSYTLHYHGVISENPVHTLTSATNAYAWLITSSVGGLYYEGEFTITEMASPSVHFNINGMTSTHNDGSDRVATEVHGFYASVNLSSITLLSIAGRAFSGKIFVEQLY